MLMWTLLRIWKHVFRFRDELLSKTQDGEISVSKATLRPSDGSVISNTISILLIAQWWAYSLEMLVSWVEAGQVLCLLEWSLPGFPSLVFTTRHSLVVDEPYGVLIDGGFDWASKTPEHFQLSGLLEAGAHLPGCQYPLARQPSPYCFLNPYPESASASPQSSRSGSSDTTTYSFPMTPTHHDSYDTWWPVPHSQNSTTPPFLYPYPAEGSGDEMPQRDFPEPPAHGLPSSWTLRPPTPSEKGVPSCLENQTDQDVYNQEIRDQGGQDQGDQDQAIQEHVQNQVFIEFLHHRQREAEDLFKRTGDPSGLLAVSRAAITAGEGVWRPSGLSYF